MALFSWGKKKKQEDDSAKQSTAVPEQSEAVLAKEELPEGVSMKAAPTNSKKRPGKDRAKPKNPN